MASNNPGVTTISLPWLSIVLSADPEFERQKHHELFYEFQSFGRTRRFYNDPSKSGAYNGNNTPPAVVIPGPVNEV
jgi:hypothetical protein